MSGVVNIVNLLSLPSGGLIYHLVSLLSIEAALGMALAEWRRTRKSADRRIALAFGGLICLKGLLLVATLLARHIPSLASSPSPSLEQATDLAALFLLGWAFLPFTVQIRAPSWLLPLGILTALFLLIALAHLCPYDTAWQGVSLLTLLGGGVALWRRRDPSRDLLWAATGVLAAGYLLQIALPSDTPHVAGWVRPAWLVTLLLLDIHVYRRLPAAMHDLTGALEETRRELTATQDESSAYKVELQTISGESLRQTQELTFLLEASKAIGASLDLSEVLQKIIENAALAVNADHAVIGVADDPDGKRMSIIAGYDPLYRKVWQASDVRFTVSNYPTIQQALQQQCQIVLQDADLGAHLMALHALLGTPQIGPVIVQPLLLQNRVLGVVLLGNARSQRPFTSNNLDIANALATQTATAVENARLYKELDEHSQKLARLLSLREKEATERQAILESIADGVIVADARGRVTMVNAAAERLFEQTTKQLQGRPIRRLLGRLSPDLAAIAQRNSATGQSSAAQSTLELEGKTVRASLAPVKRRAGDLVVGYVGVLRDVTRELAAQRAKSQFITNVSHELRTPLTSIKGYLELLIGGMAGELSEMPQRFLGIIHSNTKRMIKQINDLIAVSELDVSIELNLQTLDLRPLLEAAVTYIRPEAEERGVTVELAAVSGDLPAVEADSARVIQILEYLLSNACRFTEENGHIEVRANERVHDGRREMVIAVSDTGVGIAPEEQERIFEPFYQVGNSDTAEKDGIGVGLTIAQTLVQAQGGRIWVKSQPGEGSTFHFTLPLAAED